MGEADYYASDLRELERFIVNNPDLERLEALLDRFNIFEAVGMERQEIRHSRFLAFLLDPNESHGIGDAFVKRLLQRAVMDSPNIPASVTPIELSLWDLGQMEVRREWQHIDIFLLDEREKLAVIIENKIGTGEHSDQLNRYHAAVKKEYPEHKLLALYLTPGGDEPSHPEYLPVDYRVVCGILDELAEIRASIVEPDARVLITHYTEMLRRHIVGDSEIARLSRQIYEKHRRAINLIYQHRPDPGQGHREDRDRLRKDAKKLLERLIDDEPQLTNKRSGGNYISFYPEEWNVSSLNNNSSDVFGFLRFVFHNHLDRITLFLEASLGDRETRQKLYEMCLKHESLFENPQNPEDNKYPKFYSRTFLTPEFCETAIEAEREWEIRKNWEDFLENDLPRIVAALKQEHWIWESSDDEIETVPSRYEKYGWSDEDVGMKHPDEDFEQSGD